MTKFNLTPEYLREVLHYDHLTGIFTWKIRRGGKASKGTVAGKLNEKGYLIISVNQKMYRAHRLAWFYMTETWPENQIDHIDSNRKNNVYSNLRDISSFLNQQNRRYANKNNQTKLIGASYNTAKKKYVLQITINGTYSRLGLFDTPEEAHAAYIKAKYHQA